MSIARTLTLLALIASPAAAIEVANLHGPDPNTSTLDRLVIVCPGGDAAFRLTLRDRAIAPCPPSTVTLDFASAPGISLCPVGPEAGYGRRNQVLFAISDKDGALSFRIRGGGAAAADSVVIHADGQAFGRRAVLSTDLDGDLDVDKQDVAKATALLGKPGGAGDLDGDGKVTKADLKLLRAHLGHACGNTMGQTGAVAR
jgi:hypothetical protein